MQSVKQERGVLPYPGAVVGDHEPGAFPQKHPDRDLQSPPAWIDDTDRPISPLRSAKDPQGSAMKRMKGVEDLNVRAVRAQGIVGVGVTIRTST
jgi:hypothetical protein